MVLTKIHEKQPFDELELTEKAFSEAGVIINRRMCVGHLEQYFLSHLVDLELRNFVFWYLENIVPDRWFCMPPLTCAIPGKEHPMDLHRAGGLVLHTLRCCHFFAALRRGMKIDMDLGNYFWAALILHDTEKRALGWGLEGKQLRDEKHPQRAAENILRVGLLKEVGVAPSKLKLLADLVLHHMGPFSVGSAEGRVHVGSIELPIEDWAAYSFRRALMYLCDLLAASRTTFTAYDQYPVDWLSLPDVPAPEKVQQSEA